MLKGKIGGSIRGFTGFLTSPEALAVGAAILLTPFISRYILPLVSNLPVLGSNPAIALFASAVIVFIIARFVGGMILRPILMGVAAGMAINAIISTQFGQRAIQQVSRVAGR